MQGRFAAPPRASWALLSTLFLVACPSEPQYAGRLCTAEQGCPSPYACGEDERCHLTCADDNACRRFGEVCISGLCGTRNDGGPSDPGPGQDSGTSDRGPNIPDFGAGVDLGFMDTGPLDTGPLPDAGPGDLGPADLGPEDTGIIDLGTPDLGVCETPGTGWCDTPQTLATAQTLGFAHTCALRSDQSLWCWGQNDDGQLGLGTRGPTTGRDVPTRVGTAAWNQVSAGLWHTCGIRSNGGLWCWGQNTFSKLGLGDSALRRFPTRVGTAINWTQIQGGRSHTCGLRSGGSNNTLWCWGGLVLGQAGQPTPLQMGTASDWTSVSTFDSHTCGLRSDRSLWCFGLNLYGELGLGDTTSRESPTRVGTASDWVQVSAGNLHTCAIKLNGSLWCWGQNDDYELGLGDTMQREIPMRVGLDTDWADVFVGDTHVCALKGDRSLHCWGSNNSGRTGAGMAAGTHLQTPTQIGQDTDWTDISLGWTYTCGLKMDGSMWCWGWSNQGQLGLGDTATRWTPRDTCCPMP